MPLPSTHFRKQVYCLVLTAVLLLQCGAAPLAAFERPARILLLNSYTTEDFWTAETNRGVFAAFDERSVDVEFFVEDLDVTGTFSAVHLPELRRLYQARYTSTPPDIIITTENDATTFALVQSAGLFPDVPIVFCGLSNMHLLSIFPPEKGTGVFNEQFSLFLLREIHNLHPNAPAIAIITDMTPKGFRDVARVNEAATTLSMPGKKLTPLFGLNLDQIADSVAALPRDSVLILGHYSMTREGDLISLPTLLETIQSTSHLAIYSLSEEGAALGVLGSVSGRGFPKGYTAGEIALRLLEGAPPQNIPPVRDTETSLIFNYSGMRDFNVENASLPQGSLVLGDPFYRVRQHWPLLFGNALLLFFLGSMAVYLQKKITKRKRTENELVRQTEYWRNLFEYSPQGVLIYDGIGRIKEANSRFRAMFRRSEQISIPENILSFLSGAEIDLCREDVFPPSDRTVEIGNLVKEAAFPDGDGGMHALAFLAFPISTSNEDTNYCALFHDIQERKDLENSLLRRTFLQERITAISSRFVLVQDFAASMEAAIKDILSLSGASSASLFVLSDTGIIIPEIEIYSSERKDQISLASNFSDKDDFFWKSLMLKEKPPAIITVEPEAHKTRNSKWNFLRELGIESLSVFPLFAKDNFQGFLALADPHPHWTSSSDEPMLGLFADLMAMAIEQHMEKESLRQAHSLIHNRFTGAITVLCQVSELRDVSTSGHQRTVSLLAEDLATELQLSEEIRMAVRYAGLVHDLGKLYIPAEILGKPSKLSPAEYELVKKHPEFGYNILSLLNFPWPLAEIVLQHHEKIDGSGYPFGIPEREIRKEARILSVVDAYEAMTSDRPYRKKKNKQTALDELGELAGRSYDAKIVKAFTKMMQKRVSEE